MLNVPMIWAAAVGDDQCAVMQWLTAKSEQLPPFCFHGEEMSCAEAVRISWKWNIISRVFQSGSTTRDSHVLGGGHTTAAGRKNAF